MNESIKCPKCHYIRTEEDQYVMAGICPMCGIAYNKWRQIKTEPTSDPENNSLRIIKDGDAEMDLFKSPGSRFWDAILYTPENVDPVTFWGRCITYVFFLLWGLRFLTGGMGWEAIGSSFMHNINLPFHEFGHVLFMPFGRFMHILGGSLFQVLWPLILALVFLAKGNPFGAAIMLWWCGQSFIDVSPYIADATYRGLPLIGGSEDGHDWGNLLTMLNWLKYDYLIAKASFSFGSYVMIFSMVWGAYLLNKQRKVLSEY